MKTCPTSSIRFLLWRTFHWCFQPSCSHDLPFREDDFHFFNLSPSVCPCFFLLNLLYGYCSKHLPPDLERSCSEIYMANWTVTISMQCWVTQSEILPRLGLWLCWQFKPDQSFKSLCFGGCIVVSISCWCFLSCSVLQDLHRHNVVRMLIHNKWSAYGEKMAM